MKRLLFLYCLLTCSPKWAFAQACGGGTFQIQLQEKNCGAPQYQLFQITGAPPALPLADLYSGSFTDSSLATSLKPVPLTKEKLPKIIAAANTLRGTFADNQISFRTRELYNKPLLLKIETQTHTYFLVGMFLGGCNRTAVVSLKNKTVQLLK